jgi:hypothetical protein
MSMIEITAHREAIIEQAILSFDATANEDGAPTQATNDQGDFP